MKLIPLSGKNGDGKFVKVDDEDFEKYGRLKWHLSAGRYAARKNGKRGVYLHRLITNAPQDMVVDHKNHDTLDCRKSNLRICSQSENCRNVKVDKGYYFDKTVGRYRVQYRGKYYGLYNNEKDARRAYQLARSGVPFKPRARRCGAWVKEFV